MKTTYRDVLVEMKDFRKQIKRDTKELQSEFNVLLTLVVSLLTATIFLILLITKGLL